MRFVKQILIPAVLLGFSVPANAMELRLTAPAIERTLQQQLFTGVEGRYYLRGDQNSACYVYVDQPSVTFAQERLIVHVHTHSRLGAGMFGKCVGVGFNTEADVSVIPEAEEETIGFRDAHIDRFTGNKELDALMVPFLSRKMPQKMKINAADILRSALAKSRQSTGYDVTLDRLKIHSMLVEKDTVAVDVDGNLRVN